MGMAEATTIHGRGGSHLLDPKGQEGDDEGLVLAMPMYWLHDVESVYLVGGISNELIPILGAPRRIGFSHSGTSSDKRGELEGQRMYSARLPGRRPTCYPCPCFGVYNVFSGPSR
jgi:hypothetical protein